MLLGLAIKLLDISMKGSMVLLKSSSYSLFINVITDLHEDTLLYLSGLLLFYVKFVEGPYFWTAEEILLVFIGDMTVCPEWL